MILLTRIKKNYLNNPNIKFERLKFEIPSWINENIPF